MDSRAAAFQPGRLERRRGCRALFRSPYGPLRVAVAQCRRRTWPILSTYRMQDARLVPRRMLTPCSPITPISWLPRLCSRPRRPLNNSSRSRTAASIPYGCLCVRFRFLMMRPTITERWPYDRPASSVSPSPPTPPRRMPCTYIHIYSVWDATSNNTLHICSIGSTSSSVAGARETCDTVRGGVDWRAWCA